MSNFPEGRIEKRLRYNWPLWYAHDFDDILTQGQMVDISSEDAVFTCYTDRCPNTGDHVTTRFSVPRYGNDNSFDLESFVRGGRICQVDEISGYIRRVSMQFSEPLPFRPGETEQEALAASSDEQLIETEAKAFAGETNIELEPLETEMLLEGTEEKFETEEAEAFAEGMKKKDDTGGVETFAEELE